MKYFESVNLDVNQKPMLSKDPTIHPKAIIRDSSLGEYTEIMAHTKIEESTVGDFSYICENCEIIYTDIEKYSNIASSVRINPGFHPIERPTLHHFTYRCEKYGFANSKDDVFFNYRKMQRVRIGHDTWIGHGVVIMPGVKIGNGAVVGSNSVVTKDVSAYSIVAGAPAKVIRRRFPSEISTALEKTEWWNWDYQTIKERLEDFRDIRFFLSKYCK